MSRSFTDTESRTWKIALDPWLVTKVKNETKVLLTKWGDDNFAVAVQLREPGLLCDVLWAICDEQASENGCKEAAEKRAVELTREFARGLGGNTLLDALDALEGGIADFFMSREQAQAQAVLLEKAKVVHEMMGKDLLEKVKAIEPTQAVKSYMDSVSSSRASSESTRSLGGSPLGS